MSSPRPAPVVRGEFLLCGCQPGAEGAIQGRRDAVLPGASQAAWRRGVVTFRLPAGVEPGDDVAAGLVFARCAMRSLGQVAGDSLVELATKARDLAGPAPWTAVHAWPRDPRAGLPVAEATAAVATACGIEQPAGGVAAVGGLVLDCVLDSERRWWVGWHRPHAAWSRWPGGFYPGALPAGKVSRAWLKLDEAIASFGLPLSAGERAIELGAAPGGACQRLLEAGLDVVGVDAALVDRGVAAHPRFTQWRMRARDVPLRRFQGCDWLLTDMNIDPRSTMEALGRVATAPGVRLRGIVATLKLPDWSRAGEVSEWLDAFRDWGYEPIARQLSTGGREVCVVALRAERCGRISRSSRAATRRPAG
ncbi:MAG: SAM-dependent methyltransferase [Pirellulales bacterium]